MENVYVTMASKIVAEQSKIIGPVAYTEASKVAGLKVDKPSKTVIIIGDGEQTVNALVEQYRRFFGNAAVEVSKQAVGDLKFSVTPDHLPLSLR